MKGKLFSLAFALCMMLSGVCVLTACGGNEEPKYCALQVEYEGDTSKCMPEAYSAEIYPEEESEVILVSVAEGYDHTLVEATLDGQAIAGEYFYDESCQQPVGSDVDYKQTRYIRFTITNPDRLKSMTLNIDATNVELALIEHKLDKSVLCQVTRYGIVKNYKDGQTRLTDLTEGNVEIKEVQADGILKVPYGSPFVLLSKKGNLLFSTAIKGMTDYTPTSTAADYLGKAYRNQAGEYVYNVLGFHTRNNGTEISLKLLGSSDVNNYYYNGDSVLIYNNCLTVVVPITNITGMTYRNTTESGFAYEDGFQNDKFTFNAGQENEITIAYQDCSFKEGAISHEEFVMYVGDGDSSSDSTIAIEAGKQKIPKTMYLKIENSVIADNVEFYLTDGINREKATIVTSDNGTKFIVIDHETAMNFCQADGDVPMGKVWLECQIEENYVPANDNLVAFKIDVKNSEIGNYNDHVTLNNATFFEREEYQYSTYFYDKTKLSNDGLTLAVRYILQRTRSQLKLDGTYSLTIKNSTETIVYTAQNQPNNNSFVIIGTDGKFVDGSEVSDSQYTIEVNFLETVKDISTHTANATIKNDVKFYYSNDIDADESEWIELKSGDTLSIKAGQAIYYYAEDETVNFVPKITLKDGETELSIINTEFRDLIDGGEHITNRSYSVKYLILDEYYLTANAELTIEIAREL